MAIEITCILEGLQAPLIVRLNGRTVLRKDHDLHVTQIASVEEAVHLGAEAVATSIYFGSKYEPLMIKGAVDVAEDSVKVIASEVKLLSSATEKSFNSVYFTVDVKKSSAEDIEKIGRRLKQYPGKYDVFIKLIEDRCETLVYLGEDVKVDLSLPLKKEVDSILGLGASQFI